jgi:hypothetical protein
MSSILRQGSKGEDVVRLQNLLNRYAKPVPPLKLDGDFGPKTEAAVLQFQRQQGLQVDGEVGPKTWGKLNAMARAPSGGEHPIGRPVGGGGQVTAPGTLLEAVVCMALSQDGVMEEPPGSNRGQKVDEYNRTAGVSAGSFWCMSFVYWCFVKASHNAGVANPMPKTAYCPFLYTWAKNHGRLVGTPQRGDIFLVRHDGTHTHTGLVTGSDGAGRFTCIEGNTNNDGSNNGIGVFKRSRSNGSCDFVRFTTVSIPGQPVAVPSAASSSAVGGAIAWGKKVSPEFKAKVVKISGELGIDPSHLMACMAFETGETFSPSIRNGAGSGATGLIQFMPSTARGLGTSTDALAGMTAVQQLDYVKKYFQSSKGRLKTLEDVYMAILYPAAIGKDKDSTLFAEGTTAYRQNSGFDANRDGKITPAEVSAKVREKYSKGQQAGYSG